ncbi:MAG: phosphoribosylformylglycinamidine synthase subunit PurS [Dehalococcoidia bacterium]|nr:phosphoribosylformylglycinamidine synthase subunit PurS [Dehalococcoidia bacterium]
MSKKDTSKKGGKDAARKSAKETKPAKPGTFLARIYVSLKPTVNDPEGITIGSALGSLGFASVTGVRAGRYFQVTLNAADAKDAATQVDQMCSRLLANPVIETYAFDLAPVK